MFNKKILVTGAGGQLSKALEQMVKSYTDFNFDFKTKMHLDITDEKAIKHIFSQNSYDYCINTAAYTQVDRAETESKLAYDINAKAVGNLAKACNENNCTLIHISTDYVFDGKKNIPYTEIDQPNPINIYGKTKKAGEDQVLKFADKYYIIRTSWLYSGKNNDFYSKILDLSQNKNVLEVVNDQIGTPTSVYSLTEFLLSLLQNDPKQYGIYHFSNEGKASWYEFAKKILEFNDIKTKIIPVTSQRFKTPAQRPAFSVLDKSKVKEIFNFVPQNWEEALKLIIKNY